MYFCIHFLFLGLPVQEQPQTQPQNQQRPNDPNTSNNPNANTNAQLEHQRTSSLEQINTDTAPARKPGPPTPKTERTSIQCEFQNVFQRS